VITPIPTLWWLRPVSRGGTGRRAQRGGVEPVVLQAAGGEPARDRGVARAAEGAGRSEADVVEQEDEHVRRPGRRADGLDGSEVRLGVLRVEGQLALDLGVGDGQDVARSGRSSRSPERAGEWAQPSGWAGSKPSPARYPSGAQAGGTPRPARVRRAPGPAPARWTRHQRGSGATSRSAGGWGRLAASRAPVGDRDPR
jgi:hypothetical protein